MASTVAACPVPPDISIRPGNPFALDLVEIWRFRELLFTLAWRDLKVRYKQTILGVIWVIAQPLAGAGLFTFIFGGMADMPSDGEVPYFLISFAGFQAYFLFSSTIGKSSGCLIGNAHLITKIYFPRLILPLSSLPTTIVDFSVAMGLLAVLLAVTGVWPGVELFLLPVWIMGLFAVAMGAGLVAASLAVHFRDVRYVVPVLTQFAVWAAPVGYTLSAMKERVEEPWLVTLYMLNPLASLVEGLRWSLLGTSPPDLFYSVYSLVVAIVVFMIGAVWFRHMERRFADVI